MKVLRTLAVVLSVAVAMLVLARAGDSQPVTVTGTIMCAKCVLDKADAKSCQDVLVAADKTEYYLVKNTVTEKYGHSCKSERTAVVTGTVSDKDGRKWLEASSIEAPEEG